MEDHCESSLAECKTLNKTLHHGGSNPRASFAHPCFTLKSCSL